MLDWQLFGPGRAGHHATSVVLHALEHGPRSSRLLRGHDGRAVAERAGGRALRAAPAARRVGRLGRGAEGRAQHALLAPHAAGVRRAGRGGRGVGRYLARRCSALALGLLAKPMVGDAPVRAPAARLLAARPLAARAALAPLCARSCRSSRWRSRRRRHVSSCSSAAGAVGSLEVTPRRARRPTRSWSYVAYLGKTLWPADLAVFYPHPGARCPAGASSARRCCCSRS